MAWANAIKFVNTNFNQGIEVWYARAGGSGICTLTFTDGTQAAVHLLEYNPSTGALVHGTPIWNPSGSATYPQAVTAGNLLICVIETSNNSVSTASITDTLGSNIPSPDPFDKSHAQDDVTTGSAVNLDSGNTATTTQASELLIGLGNVNAETTMTATGSMTQRTYLSQSGAGQTSAVQDQVISSTGAYHATMTAGSGGRSVCVIITFKLTSVQVEVGTFVLDTGGTTTTVPTGFQGKALILFTHVKNTLSETAPADYDFIVFDGTNGGNIGWNGADAVGTTNVSRVMTSKTSTGQIGWFIGPALLMTGIALNATPNFVLTFSGTPGLAYEVSYILIGGTDITNVKYGVQAMRSSNGTQNVTGVGFQGDAVFILSDNASIGDGTNVQADNSLGFAISSSKRWAWSGTVQTAQSSSAGVKGQSYLSSSNVLVVNHLGTIQIVADFAGFTSDGFDLNYTTTSGSTNDFIYLVIKGSTWDCGVQAKPSTATAQTATGMAFQPKLVGMLMSSAIALDTQTSNDISMFGAGIDSTHRAYAGAYHNDAINTVAKSAGSNSKILHEMNATANADFTSMNSDGWTITWDAVGTAFQVAWFAVGDAPTRSPGLSGGYSVQIF